MASGFTLQPVVEGDLPALMNISDAAFKTDTHTQLKAAHPTKPYDHGAGMGPAFESWLSLPKQRLELIKAVDTHSGEVLGFICWGKRLQAPDNATPSKITTTEDTSKAEAVARAAEQKETAEEIVEVAEAAEGRVGVKPSAAGPEEKLSPEEALDKMTGITSDHLATFQKRIMANGVRCMYIIGISVHPDHQGRGVGSALLRYGTDIADREGVFCWVHSSEAGAKSFIKNGFVEVDRLTIDLDEWADKFGVGPPPAAGGETGDATPKWGFYNFRYFVRRPKGAWGS